MAQGDRFISKRVTEILETGQRREGLINSRVKASVVAQNCYEYSSTRSIAPPSHRGYLPETIWVEGVRARFDAQLLVLVTDPAQH